MSDGVVFKTEAKRKEPRRWIRDSNTRKQIIQSCHNDMEGGTLAETKQNGRSPSDTTGKVCQKM